MFRVTSTDDTKYGAIQKRVTVMSRMCQVVVMVAKDGWNYDKYDHRSDTTRYKYTDHAMRNPSDGMNVRLSMNGPLRMTYAQWRELVDTVEAAWEEVRDDA